MRKTIWNGESKYRTVGELYTAIHPAQFIVRRNSYMQIEDYPEACAELTARIIQLSPRHFPEAYAFLSNSIRNSPPLNRDWAAKRRKGFGLTRADGSDMYTDLTGKYESEGKEMRDTYGDEVNLQFIYFHENKEKPITLSRIVLKASGDAVHHPNVGEDDYMDEYRWSSICQSYNIAIDGKKSFDERKKASLVCYAVLSHDCPYIRGSSMLARITLEYLSWEVGFKVPLVKSEVDLNTKAITRSVDQFIREWNNGDYFDMKTTPDEVMEWHKRRIVCKAPSNLR